MGFQMGPLAEGWGWFPNDERAFVGPALCAQSEQVGSLSLEILRTGQDMKGCGIQQDRPLKIIRRGLQGRREISESFA